MTQKALQLTRLSLTAPPTLAVATIPIPALKSGFALVKVHGSAIQPADKVNAQGLFPNTVFPRVPGRDYAGVVVDLDGSSDEKSKWVGKEVYGSGGSNLGFTEDGPHAEYLLVSKDVLVEKPMTLTLDQAATVGLPFSTALLCLRRTNASKNDVVLVLGSNGAVGSAAVSIAKAIGVKKVLTAALPSKTPVDVEIPSEDVSASLKKQISSLTDGKGVDVVVDTVGSLPLMAAAVENLGVHGRYTWIASPRGDVPKDVSFDIFQAYRKEINLLGCNTVLYTISQVADELRQLTKWFNKGLIPPPDTGLWRKVTLEEAITEGYKNPMSKVIIGLV